MQVYDEASACRLYVLGLQARHKGDAEAAKKHLENSYTKLRLWPDLEGNLGKTIDVDGKIFDAKTGAEILQNEGDLELSEEGIRKVVRVVGIGGCTRSGKGTLAKALSSSRPDVFETIVHCDKYWKARVVTSTDKSGNKYENWEEPAAVDEDAILKALKRTRLDAYHHANGKRVYVVIEGFLLYSLPRVLPFLDHRLYLTLDRLSCCRRRVFTTFVPQDYFENVLWPNFVEHNSKIIDVQDIIILDGQTFQDQLLRSAGDVLEGRKVESRVSLHVRNLQGSESVSSIYEEFRIEDAKHQNGPDAAGIPPTPKSQSCYLL